MKYITKASGEKELFNIKKFRRSLQKAGTPSDLIDEMVQEIIRQPNLDSTHKIYKFVLKRLHQKNHPVAARYNLKYALFELGPTGFTFEQFIAALLKEQGYSTMRDQTIAGWCTDHEIDIVASLNHKEFFIECKFHNHGGIKTDVKVPLYCKARFDDIIKKKQTNNNEKKYFGCVTTNTKFTSKAVVYSECVKLIIVGWSYPKGKSLPDLIKKYALYPITTLTTLSKKQKNWLMQQGFVLCRNAHKYKKELRKLGFSTQKIKQFIEENEAICHI